MQVPGSNVLAHKLTASKEEIFLLSLQYLICIHPPHLEQKQSHPSETSPQVKEHPAIGVRNFFKAIKLCSGSLASDSHISSSLAFDELCARPKLSDWMSPLFSLMYLPIFQYGANWISLSRVTVCLERGLSDRHKAYFRVERKSISVWSIPRFSIQQQEERHGSGSCGGD